jgi:hypothetical protein
MTTDLQDRPPRTRRALLAGVLGGIGAWVAATATRVDPAAAGAGDPIRMGRLNRASSTATTLQTKTSAPAFLVKQLGAGHALKGEATTGRAVMGVAGSNGTGLWGSSPDHNGVHGMSEIGNGVLAESISGPGVYAFSTSAQGVYGVSETGGAVVGFSYSGVGIFGDTTVGWAGDFAGRVRVQGYQQFDERGGGDPEAPGQNAARLFVRDNGSGKGQLCVRFPTGAIQVIATEP